jgi:hypothetical protein
MKLWDAVIESKVATNSSHSTSSGWERDTIGQMVSLVVPDAGGYFSTKALLESSFGPGCVKRLTEK